MPVAPPSGYSTATKTPGFVVGIEFGASGRSAGAAPMKLALLGNKLAAGTAALDTPVFVAGTDDARTLFAAGSELFRQCKAAFDQFPRAAIYGVPVTQSAGVAATALLAFTGPATAGGSARVTLDGEQIEIPVAAGDTATAIGAALAAKINAQTDWPVTASATTGTVTVTQRNTGTRGNDMLVRVELREGIAGVTVALNGGTATPTRVAGKFGAGTATVGTLTDDVTNALAAMASQKYDHIAAAQSDTANWTRIRNHVNTYSGVGERKRQRAIVATPKDLASAITDAGGQNGLLLQIAWHYNAEQTTAEIAAQAAAGRLWGDGAVGGGIGRARGEEAYRAANLDGLLLATIREQYDPADQPLGTEIELALNSGLTPLAPSPANPGYTRVVRSITSRFKDAAGNPNYAVLDTSKPEVLHYAADRLEGFLAVEYANKNIAPDTADKRPPKHPDVVTPSMIRSALGAELYRMADEGLAVRVEENMPAVDVQIDATNPALVLAFIPFDVIEGLHNLAATLSQIG